jgi:hypothetical protein
MGWHLSREMQKPQKRRQQAARPGEVGT